jgi:hypothetical protein
MLVHDHHAIARILSNYRANCANYAGIVHVIGLDIAVYSYALFEICRMRPVPLFLCPPIAHVLASVVSS